MPQVVQYNKVHITLNQDNPTDQQIWQRIRHEFELVMPPIPANPQPSPGTTIFRLNSWQQDFAASFKVTNSPETVSETDCAKKSGSNITCYGKIAPEVYDGKDTLVFRFNNALKKEDTVGLRLKYGNTPGWLDMKPYFDQTVEFWNMYYFPQMLAPIDGQGNGWITAGWQMKALTTGNASLAMNAHQTPAGQLRWYLQGNNLNYFKKADFPIIPIGQWFAAALQVHFHYDPAKGWAKLLHGGDEILMTGQTMSLTKSVGPYQTFYGQGVTTEEMVIGDSAITLLAA